MFWGLILEPQRRYSQVVKKPFRITMAALDVNSSNEDPTQVIVTFQNRNFLMCTLQKGSILNERLDLRFEEGDHISFAANGESHVHLTGYLLDAEEELELDDEEEQEEGSEQEAVVGKKRQNDNKNLQRENIFIEALDSEVFLPTITKTAPTKKSKTTLELLENANSDSEDDSDFSLSTNALITGSSDEEDEESGEEEEVNDEEEEDDEDGEEDEDEDEDVDGVGMTDDDEEEEGEDEDLKKEVKHEVTSPKKRTRSARSQRNATNTNDVVVTPKAEKMKKGEKEKVQENASPQKNGSPPKKRTIEGGVSIEELKVGNGPVAKAGKFVQVYYEGRLKSNNKMFDSATKGAGFEFRLGRQEVIKGWDIGVAGMKVGGKRKIICPPHMAYGAKGSPPAIPPHSTLVFEVELKKVK